MKINLKTAQEMCNNAKSEGLHNNSKDLSYFVVWTDYLKAFFIKAKLEKPKQLKIKRGKWSYKK